jgi:hypothetical protein
LLNSWLLFLYKVPHEPSSRRVYVWRKLKRLGAVLLHDAVWVLPMTSCGLEQLQKLSAEIVQLGGDASVWEARLALSKQDEDQLQVLLAEVKPTSSKTLAE